MNFLSAGGTLTGFGVKRRRGQRLAAHNERRQFASQTRSCGCLPRRGKHCSHPGFAPLNRGPCSQPRNPSLRCKRQRGYKTKPGADARLRAGHARPLQGCVNRYAREGQGRAAARPFCSGRRLPVDEWHSKVAGRACPAPTDCCFRQRGFGGAWRRTTSAASLLRKHARAVVCPAGANIARSPVSLRSTVAPRSQPRNPRLKSGGRGGGVKNGQ